MFTQFKIYIFIAIFAIAASSLGAAYWYYTWSQDEMQVLRENAVKLQIAVDTQKETIKIIKIDANLAAQIGVKEVTEQYQKARKENNILRNKLAKHDIGFLAAKKPGLVRKIINKGTANVGRCYEIMSGSPLTEQEKTATKRSKINSSCPDIANPAYRRKK